MCVVETITRLRCSTSFCAVLCRPNHLQALKKLLPVASAVQLERVMSSYAALLRTLERSGVPVPRSVPEPDSSFQGTPCQDPFVWLSL